MTASIRIRHGRDVIIIRLGISNIHDTYSKGCNGYSRQHAKTNGPCKKRVLRNPKKAVLVLT